ncbi:PHP-associated domain-containing protein [Anaeromyxobacter paludicola]|uniref:Histidinol-phosphatase n=1 Tax=Anaeromyxobacter paludicola TaxID=2918171 RepID=A0ABM7X5P5_9BACT|nr:PHP domain-containing protein [Anaeromyxobacter paludicola]BDG07135.1 histidinol-phosphatase [Anaeromyxobacter paludicola]
MLIDLHVHSRHTQGCALEVRDVLRRAREEGLDGVVFTDLNGLEALPEARAAAKEEGVLGLVGAELVTDHGHYLCYFPEPEKVPAPAQLFGTPPWPVREVLARVTALGGAVVAAHPYDKTIDRPCGDFIFTLDGLAAVEGLHARKRGPANDLAIEAADHLNLPCVAGSGALGSLDELGKAATLFRRPVASEADLVAQLKAGTVHCVAIGVTPQPAEAARRGPRRDERGGRGDRRGGRRERR